MGGAHLSTTEVVEWRGISVVMHIISLWKIIMRLDMQSNECDCAR